MTALEHPSRTAAAVLVVGLAVSGWSAQSYLALAQQRLHFRCSWEPDPGYPGSWVCADGISYLGVAVGTGLVLAAVCAAALLVIAAGPTITEPWAPLAGGPREDLRVLLLVLAVFPSGYAIASTCFAAAGADPAGWHAQYPDGLWWGVVGPAAVLMTLAALAALLAAGLPWRRPRAVCAAVACVAWLAVPAAEQGLTWVAPLSLALVVAALVLPRPSAGVVDPRGGGPSSGRGEVFRRADEGI